jgi:hypothetical protein
MSRLSLLLTLAAACALGAPAAASAATPTTWLCKPGLAADPCTSGLTSTVVPASGGSTREVARAARSAKIDCFYVYPTVSDQKRTNATLARDPEVKAIARFQAARFSQHCRVFAPVYRQLTLQAIAVPRGAGSRSRQLAYGDVRDAWREYLRRHNKGRGVVLVGHSQGTFMLRELIKREIDPSASARRKLVSGLLTGGNVEVRKGSDRGGDFRNVRACRSATQLGCVVGYSMFDQRPAEDARFGRTPTSGREILCTNPAALGGGSGTLDTYTPATPFPGTIGAVLRASITLPDASTPWLKFPDRVTARCRKEGGAVWLHVEQPAGDPRPVFTPELGPTWGLHLGDINIAYGQLTDLVRRQAAAYARRSGG